MENTMTETKFKKVTSRMVEAGRIERRRYRVASRRAGIYGMGVGMTKRDYLTYSRSPVEIEYMKAVKAVFDPNGIMNPGKIFAV